MNRRKCTDSTLARYAATRYEQRALGDGLNGWRYAYANDAPITKRFVGCGIELAVHLGGEWTHETLHDGARTLRRGEIVRVSAGERYAHWSRGAAEPGLQVGFVVHGDALRVLEASAGGALRIRGDGGLVDAEVVDLAAAIARGEDTAVETVRSVVLGYVERHAEVDASPMAQAKRELERFFEHDLPIEMVAETGGTSATAFTRRFVRTYGLAPSTYRVLFRANAAARMLWMRPDLSVAAIGEVCGFRSPSYFFRTFRGAFGLTPNAARARFLGADVVAAARP